MTNSKKQQDLNEEINELKAEISQLRQECDEHPESLQRYEELRRLFENSPEGYARTDMDGKMQDMNQAYVDMLGYSRKELYTMKYADLTPEKWHDFENKIIVEEVMVHGFAQPYEKEYRHRDGHLFSVEIRAFLSRDSEDVPNGLWAIVTDISERQKTLAILKNNEQRFRDITDTIADWIWEIDLDGIFQFISTNSEHLLGTATDEITGKCVFDFMPASDAERVRANFNKAVSEKTKIDHFTVWFSVDGTTKRLLKLGGIPIFDDNGEITGFRGAATDVTAKHFLENELKESEQRFKDIAESVGDMIWEADTNGVYTFIGGDPESMLGYSRESLTGMSLFELIPEHLRESMRRQYATVIREGKSVSEFENINITKDGREIFILTNGKPVFDTDGSVIGYRAIDRNVTEQRKLQQNLLESEEKFRNISDHAQDAIIMIDKNGQTTFWNKAAEQIFGYRAEEMLGKNLHKLLMPPQFEQEYNKGFDTFIKTDNGPIIGKIRELTALRKDGSSIDVEISVSTTKVGGVTHAIGIIRDISDRKKAAADLNLLNTGISQANDAVVITDTNGDIVYVNPSFEMLSGYSAGEVLRKNPRIMKSGKHPQLMYKKMWEKITTGKIWKGEIVNKKKNGDLYYEEMTITPVITSGETTNFIAVKRDVTERKQLELKIDNLRADYESFMRHEIKNLLSPLRGYTEILKMSLNDTLDDRSQMFLDKIMESVDNATKLIDRLKQLQDFEHGEYELDRIPYSFEELVRAKVLEFRIMTANSGINIHFDCSAEKSCYLIDLALMPNVFNNLINNAIEHIADLKDIEQKIVAINMYNIDDSLVISINNKGEPVNPDRLLTFFDKFNSNRKKAGGTGLGTTYASLVTIAHGGRIAVDSNELDGTTVTLTFPGIQNNNL